MTTCLGLNFPTQSVKMHAVLIKYTHSLKTSAEYKSLSISHGTRTAKRARNFLFNKLSCVSQASSQKFQHFGPKTFT